MFKLTSFLTVSMLFAFILFQSCRGLPGTNGATGVTGAQGPQGVAGANGASGTNGKDGNANVQGKVLTFQASEWIKKTYGTAGKYEYKVAANIPEITQSVVDKGLVIAYGGNGSGGYFQLPYSYSFDTSVKTYVVHYDVVHYLNGVTFWLSESDGFPTAPTSAEIFKIVIITPQGRVANPNVNYNNYAEVAKAFNLE